MIVRLDLEHRREPFADVDGAGVFSRALQHLRPAGWQRLEMDARALVAAVLRPHDREDSELGQVRFTAEESRDPVELFASEPVALEDLRVDHAGCWTKPSGKRSPATINEVKITRPSRPPRSASQARSGCGIMPTTLRVSLQSPAIAPTDPFGFHASSTCPSGSV